MKKITIIISDAKEMEFAPCKGLFSSIILNEDDFLSVEAMKFKLSVACDLIKKEINTEEKLMELVRYFNEN